MRTLLAPLAAFFLISGGCQSEPEPTGTTPAPPKAEPGRPAVLASEPTPQAAGTNNPNRLFQLKNLTRGSIKVNGHPVPVWLMNDDEKRQEGMMFLTDKEVKPEEGMLFVFPSVQGADHGFWMENTLLPLDIIYITSAGKVLRSVEGKPLDRTNLKAGGAFQYVLELRAGGAKRLKVKPGSPVDIPASLRRGAI